MPAVRAPRLWRVLRRRRRLVFLVALDAIVAIAIGVAQTSFGGALLARAESAMIAASARAGLVVVNVEVEGRQTTDPATIMAALGAVRGTPILAVSPSLAKQRLEALPWVQSATIERRLPDTLRVRLVERKPLALWQHGGKQELIDRDGEIIPVDDLSRFAQLPLVVGEDAARPAAALIDLVASEPELASRVTAAIRVGGRRWNLRIDDAIDVLLPENRPEAAWAQLARLERENGVLKRDVQLIDMRLPDRTIVRVNDPAAREAAPAKKPRPAGKNT